MMRTLAVLIVCVLAAPAAAQLKPGVAVEAEDFTVTRGWRALKNGAGNYMVDLIGFCHVSGERFLSLPGDAKDGAAFKDVDVPVAGDFRLWARYEYPAFCETRFRVRVEQSGRVLAEHVMGKKDGVRYGFGDPTPKAQHDPSWGPEGIMIEAMTVKGLKAGKARIYLEGVEQPRVPGVAANRNVDLIYLTSDIADSWLPAYRKRVNLYPILEAVRETIGPRWEARFTNKGPKPAAIRVRHVYNRLPWGMSEPAKLPTLNAGEVSGWIGLQGQDTAHFSMIEFDGSGETITVELRPVVGTNATRTFTGSTVRAYVPPYPDKGEEPTTPEEAINRILAALKKGKAPGKVPTQPLCYGGWMPLGRADDYGRKYAALYSALGFRSLHPAHSGPAVLDNLKAVGIEPSKSWMVMGYRNPPTRSNIDRARIDLNTRKLTDKVRFFDYGDEIHFSEWLGMLLAEDVAVAKAAGEAVTAQQMLNARWRDWLKRKRSKLQVKDYWLPTWGATAASGLRPDSSAAAAIANPRLYVDSALFYEELAIDFAATGMKAVKQAFGDDVLCGANYSCHPFYYPSSTMYIKWFRGGAADLGRHSEYFWQTAQLGPMINGYIAEHFRAGMRDNPKAVLRQYTMPHAPGNTDANFLRSAFTHLAHGATMLDFFGVGLNETFTENHIDHRAMSRFKAVRDVTHCVGLVEDLLPTARPVSSRVALLVSESTERWDHAGIATDRAGRNLFGPDFRKTRTHFHLERLGLWKALTFLGHTPELVTEDDVIAGKLKGFGLLVLVGDHWPREMVPAVEKWVKAGGVALGTAGSGGKNTYDEATSDWHKLAGLKSVRTDMKTTFLRPRQELPFQKMIGTVSGDGWKMPVIATEEVIAPAEETKVLAKFDDKRPAMSEREVGKGRIIYIAAHPGIAYLWSALQPPTVPDRGPTTHSIPTAWDKGARAMLEKVVTAAGEPIVRATPALIDARLLKAKGGYIVSVASYTGKTGEEVVLRIRVAGVTKATSAYHGELKIKAGKGTITLTLPSLTYGDVIRLE